MSVSLPCCLDHCAPLSRSEPGHGIQWVIEAWLPLGPCGLLVFAATPSGCRVGRAVTAKWTASDMPAMTGKTVVVTGATSGIGLIAAREFARVGARVILAVRNVQKGEETAKAMTGDVEVRQLEGADLTSIREFAAHWTGALDVLINNAGIMDVPLARTRDGLDLQTATNSFGPFLLT